VSERQRIVLDTSVLVSALRSNKGASFALLQLVRTDRFQVILGNALLLEYEDVLLRQEHIGPSDEKKANANELLGDIARLGTFPLIRFQYRPQLRDPDDEFVLETAINGFADAIVTHNTRDFLPAALRFGIRVLTPGDIIREERVKLWRPR